MPRNKECHGQGYPVTNGGEESHRYTVSEYRKLGGYRQCYCMPACWGSVRMYIPAIRMPTVLAVRLVSIPVGILQGNRNNKAVGLNAKQCGEQVLQVLIVRQPCPPSSSSWGGKAWLSQATHRMNCCILLPQYTAQKGPHAKYTT